MKIHLSDLEDNRFIAYHKEDGAYRTTYKRICNHTLATWKKNRSDIFIAFSKDAEILLKFPSMNFIIENGKTSFQQYYYRLHKIHKNHI
ncbi:MAG: hypothetical protein DLM72_21570 [Candidatus Nitrosopolaris wilkensis]|nr:MAG: hypothetical protein DLM72_21570 [Candidatus Nitrosopolaris wilkensis]